MKNKNSLIYAVVFMLLLTAVTTLVLALLDQSTRVRVEEQQLLEKHQAILYSAGIDVPPEEVDAVFAERFIEVADAEETYEYYEGEKLVGYIVPYEGGLLWGSVTGYVGISAEGDKLLGMDVVSNSETPGLGGRITEEWYRSQFRNLELVRSPYLVYRPASGGNVDAIAGATQTSESLRAILNNTLNSFMDQKGGN